MVYDGSRSLFTSVWIRLIIEGITDIAYATDPAYISAYIGAYAYAPTQKKTKTSDFKNLSKTSFEKFIRFRFSVMG